MWPFFCSFLLSGGLIAFPGSVFAEILQEFRWEAATFGSAMLIQGAFAFIGTAFTSKLVFRFNLSILQMAGALCSCLGIAFVYGKLSMPFVWAGYAAIGSGIGICGIVNNAWALKTEHPPKYLNLLNMGFTAGAVFVPTLSWALFAYLQSNLGEATSFAPALQIYWKWPIYMVCAGFGLLAVYSGGSYYFRHEKRAIGNQTARAVEKIATKSKEVSQSMPAKPTIPTMPRDFVLIAFASSLGLFCYVGSEINMSNGWVELLSTSGLLSLKNSKLASPLYWAGLLLVRGYFAFSTPKDANIAKLLAVFGTLTSIALLATLILTHPAMTFASPIVNALAENAAARTTANVFLLALPLCSGLFIGSSYSFLLGAISSYYRNNPHFAAKGLFITVQAGVFGSVVLPFCFGMATQWFKISGGFVFLLFCVVTLSAASFTLRAKTSLGPLARQ